MAHAERPAVVESYIVRIYRRNPKQRRTLQGVVEDVQSHTRRAFRSVNQLYEILGMGLFSSGGPPTRGGRRRAGRPES